MVFSSLIISWEFRPQKNSDQNVFDQKWAPSCRPPSDFPSPISASSREVFPAARWSSLRIAIISSLDQLEIQHDYHWTSLNYGMICHIHVSFPDGKNQNSRKYNDDEHARFYTRKRCLKGINCLQTKLMIWTTVLIVKIVICTPHQPIETSKNECASCQQILVGIPFAELLKANSIQPSRYQTVAVDDNCKLQILQLPRPNVQSRSWYDIHPIIHCLQTFSYPPARAAFKLNWNSRLVWQELHGWLKFVQFLPNWNPSLYSIMAKITRQL